MTEEAVPPPPPPPVTDGPVWSRENLIRPRQGRYVAGVSGAIGRATNTDPVLWRVVLAVLGVFGGVGVLIYLVGWLLIPAEGDTGSPIESLLGRGRSGMQPISVVLLGAGTVIVFAFVVNDGFRAALLAAAVLVCGALVLKRNSKAATTAGFPAAGSATGPANYPAAGPTAGFAAGAATPPTTPGPDATLGPDATVEPAPPAAPVEEPTVAFAAAGGPATATAPPGEPVIPPRFAPPTSESRPPFAPHGPWAQTASQPPYPPPPLPPRPPKRPKPPRERSKLGRITFFGIVVVMGVLVALDVAGMSVPISAYFAAALVTISLGLIVGAWFGRARGLIALAVLAALGLGVSSGVESYGGQVANNTYRPQTLAAVADRYDFTIGNATIDLRSLDFAAQDQTVTIEMRLGQVQVLLPPTVDTSVTADVQDGRVNLFGQDHDAKELGAQEITDLGTDGKGGGTLHLAIQMNAGNVEVKR